MANLVIHTQKVYLYPHIKRLCIPFLVINYIIYNSKSSLKSTWQSGFLKKTTVQI